MKCQRCSGPTVVPVSREVEGGDGVARIRVCKSRACAYSFVTTERAVEGPPPAAVAVAMAKRDKQAKRAKAP